MGVGTVAVKFWLWFWAVIAVIALVTGLGIAAWQGGWFVSNANNNRAYEQQQNGLNNQDTNRTLIEANFQTLSQQARQVTVDEGARPENISLVGQDKVEATATAGRLCNEGAEINDAVAYPSDIQAWFKANCLDGAVSPDSVYYLTIPAS